ncbi:MAG TPA: VWA domain-containing protein [Pyrinomonadaceae bacterium]|nr:VWA domain-containing protein [Pyrinomonadaceae bacterium]
MHTEKFKRPRLALIPILAALCLPAPAQQPAQTTTPPAKDDEEVVRISTDLVQTDVMVFDKEGKFVDGLKPEQFELKVDGRAQQVAFFERVEAGTVDEDAQIAAARGGASGVKGGGAVVPLDRGRTVVFFVDDMHLSPASSMQIRKTLLRFIDEEVGQNDEAVVISATGQIGFLQQLTDNKAVLRAAAARLNPRSYSVRDGDRPTMTESHAAAIERYDQQVTGYFVDALLRENPGMRRESAENMVQARARAILQQSTAIALGTLGTLESTVRGFGPLPGRKLLFFISDGFLVDNGDNLLHDRMRRIADAAARAGVVIYSLDAQGLRTDVRDITENNFDASGQLSQVNAREISDMQAPLFQLANETGGRALVNTNALNKAVSGAIKETARYYLLAWRPEPAQGGGAPKYQRIEVAVRGRSDLKVVVRQGFYNVTPPPPAPRAEKKKDEKKQEAATEPKRQQSPAERDLFAALRAPFPRETLPTTMAVGYFHDPKAGTVLTTSVEIDREALTYQEGERRHADFDVLGVVIDDHGKTVSQFGQRLTVTPDPSIPASQQHVVYSFQSPLTPGLYQVRAAARDTASGRTGSAMRWIEVPELSQSKLSLSSIFLGERAPGEDLAVVKPEDIQHSVLLSVGRRFRRTSFIRFLTFVYNAAPADAQQPDVALQIQIFRDDQPVFTAPLTKLRSEGILDITHVPYMAELNLNDFPAGRYALQITAIDRTAKTSASQRANFIIE